MTIRWGSRKETALALGVSRQRVEQYLAKGLFEETEHGIDIDAAQAAYARNVDVVRKAQHDSIRALKADGPAEIQAEATPQAPTSSGDPHDAVPSIDYNKHRARREKYNADLQEMKFQTESGRLIARDEIKAREFAVARKLRDRILGFPAKVANYVPPEAMKILTDEFEALIREMQEDAARICEQTTH